MRLKAFECVSGRFKGVSEEFPGGIIGFQVSLRVVSRSFRRSSSCFKAVVSERKVYFWEFHEGS